MASRRSKADIAATVAAVKRYADNAMVDNTVEGRYFTWGMRQALEIADNITSGAYDNKLYTPDNHWVETQEQMEQAVVGQLRLHAPAELNAHRAFFGGVDNDADALRECIADLWPRASYTMGEANRESWKERLAALDVEIDG